MWSKSAEYIVLAMALAMLAAPNCVTAESPDLDEKQRVPLQLPFGVDPSDGV